jgi:hypothetical protein
VNLPVQFNAMPDFEMKRRVVGMRDPTARIDLRPTRERPPLPLLRLSAGLQQDFPVLRLEERQPWVAVTFVLALPILLP